MASLMETLNWINWPARMLKHLAPRTLIQPLWSQDLQRHLKPGWNTYGQGLPSVLIQPRWAHTRFWDTSLTLQTRHFTYLKSIDAHFKPARSLFTDHHLFQHPTHPHYVPVHLNWPSAVQWPHGANLIAPWSLITPKWPLLLSDAMRADFFPLATSASVTVVRTPTVTPPACDQPQTKPLWEFGREQFFAHARPFEPQLAWRHHEGLLEWIIWEWQRTTERVRRCLEQQQQNERHWKETLQQFKNTDPPEWLSQQHSMAELHQAKLSQATYETWAFDAPDLKDSPEVSWLEAVLDAITVQAEAVRAVFLKPHFGRPLQVLPQGVFFGNLTTVQPCAP